MVTEVNLSYLMRLVCPAQDHFIFLILFIISMTFVLSLTQMLVFIPLYVMLSILLSMLVCRAAFMMYRYRKSTILMFNITFIVSFISTTNLAACVCVCAKCDQFLPVRSHFDTKRPVHFFHIATFPSPTFGPLFAFHCPLFFYEKQ